MPQEILTNEDGLYAKVTAQSHVDARVSKLTELVLNPSFRKLFELHEEVNSIVKSCELTAEFILRQSMMYEAGTLFLS